MLATIAYNADALNTPQRIIEHIALLLTGTTVVGSLTGGNIDAGSSSINVAYHTPSYELFDSINPDTTSSRKIFKIPVHDDPTSFFYLELLVSGNDIDHKLWENWNATTHVGTGQAYYTTTGFEFVTMTSYTTASFTLTFTITATHCLARSVYSNGTIKYCRGFMQYERRELWDTVANGSKPVIVTYNDYLFQVSTHAFALPHRRSDNSVYSLSPAVLYTHTAYGSSQKDAFTLLIGNSASAARGLDANEVSIHNMYEFGFSYLSSGERFLSGKVFDMFVATYGNGAQGDTVSVNGDIYIIWEANANYRLAIRNG